MNPGITIASEARNAAGIAAAIDALPRILEEAKAPDELVGMYGYGCRIHADLWYQPMAIRAMRLTSFLRESIDQGIFLPGFSDLHLKAKDGGFEIFLSHEGDIRLGGTDAALVARIASRAALAGVQAVVVRATD